MERVGISLRENPSCTWALLRIIVGYEPHEHIRVYRDLLRSPYAGPFWETWVCAELRKKLRLSERGDLYFWRDRNREVDFLIHRAGRFELLDAKWSEQPDAGAAANLERTSQELPRGSVVRTALICRALHAYPVGERSQAVPLGEA